MWASRLLILSVVYPVTSGVRCRPGSDIVVCDCIMARVFSLFSSTIILSTNSVTRSSRCVIWFYWEELTSFCSTMSSCSLVTAAFNSWIISLDALFLSSWSILTRVWCSCISLTFVSSLFPAVCIYLMEASASSFHFLSVFYAWSRLPTNAAYVRRF